jgi:hypothetical protein
MKKKELKKIIKERDKTINAIGIVMDNLRRQVVKYRRDVDVLLDEKNTAKTAEIRFHRDFHRQQERNMLLGSRSGEGILAQVQNEVSTKKEDPLPQSEVDKAVKEMFLKFLTDK